MSKMLEAANPAGAIQGGGVVDRRLRVIEYDHAFARLLGIAATADAEPSLEHLRPDLVAPVRRVLATARRESHIPLRNGQSDANFVHLDPLHTSRGTVAGVEITIEQGRQLSAKDGDGSSTLVPTITDRDVIAALEISISQVPPGAVPAILFISRRDGACDYISQHFYDFTGLPAGSGEGDGWTVPLHPDDYDPTLRAW